MHPLAVAKKCKTEEFTVVALLHDVLEDTELTRTDLLLKKIPSYLVDEVCILTKMSNEVYDKYIDRVSKSSIARRIKIAELECNMDLSRLLYITKEDLTRVKKYMEAYNILKFKEEIGKELC